MVSSTIDYSISSIVLLIYCCTIISTIPTIRGREIEYEFGRTPHHRNKKHRRRHQHTILLTSSHQQHHAIKQRRLQDKICSCSPTSFTITLDFFNNCFDDTLSDNVGIADTDCTIEVGDPTSSLLAVEENFLDASPTSTGSSEGLSTIEINSNNSKPQWVQTTNEAIAKYILQQAKFKNKNKTSNRKKRGYQEALQLLEQYMIRDTNGGSSGTEENSDVESDDNNNEEENDSENTNDGEEEDKESIEAVDDINKKKKRLKKGRSSSTRRLSTTTATQQQQQHTSHNKRTLQGGGPASPTRITSITLIEIDVEGTVINIDNSNDNVNLQGGDSIEFTSISNDLQQGVDINDQLELVPSTQVLFMVGNNARGEEVRGRFVWRYTNSCNSNARTLQVNDEIAWSIFSEVTDQQIEEFCPANSGGGPPGPTPRPTSGDTPNPTTKPTLPPVEDTDIPTFTPTEVPTIDNGDMPTTNAPVSPTPQPIIVTPSPVAPTPSTPPPVPGPVSTPFPTTVDSFPTSKPINDMSMVYYSSVDEYEKPGDSYYSSIDNILHHFGSSKGTWSSHHSSSSWRSKSGKRGKGRKSKKRYWWGSSSSGSSSSGKGWYHYNSRSSSSSSSSSSSWSSSGSSSSWSSGSKSGKKR